MRFPTLLLFAAASAHAAPDIVVLSQTFTVGQNIPDAGQLLVTHDYAIGGGLLTDVSVSFLLTNAPGDAAYNGDFYAALGHQTILGNAAGYAVLLNRIGSTSGDPFGSGDNGFNVTFTSAATTDIHTVAFDPDNPVTLTGTFAPDGRETSPTTVVDTDSRTATLTSFTTPSNLADGQWRLFFSDEALGGTGRLQSWTLGLTLAPDGTTPLTVPTDATLTVPTSQTLTAALVNQGHLTAITGVTFSGAVTGAGNYTGNITFAGSFSPGNSPALVTFTGNVTLASTNQLFIDLAGLTRGTGYDALDISGTLTQGGTFHLGLLSGFTPAAGNSFNLFAATGGIVGSFATLDLPTLPGTLAWDTTQLGATGVLSVFSTAVPEPATLAGLLGLATLGLYLRRRK